MDCKQTLEEYCAEFESVLAEYLQSMQVRPPVLAESVRYSLTLGGKRLRPVLMFACAKFSAENRATLRVLRWRWR